MLDPEHSVSRVRIAPQPWSAIATLTSRVARASARRRHHGQRLRPAGDAGRDRRARGVSGALRGAHRLRPPHTRGDGRLRQPRPSTAGCKVIVAGAGGAAHSPGMTASMTPLPVIGVPVPLKQLDGLDSLLSIVQMPAGSPSRRSRSATRRTRGCSRFASSAASDPELLHTMDEVPGRTRGDDQREGRRRPQALRLRLSPSHARQKDGSDSSMRRMILPPARTTFAAICCSAHARVRVRNAPCVRAGNLGRCAAARAARRRPPRASAVSAVPRNGRDVRRPRRGLGSRTG